MGLERWAFLRGLVPIHLEQVDRAIVLADGDELAVGRKSDGVIERRSRKRNRRHRGRVDGQQSRRVTLAHLAHEMPVGGYSQGRDSGALRPAADRAASKLLEIEIEDISVREPGEGGSAIRGDRETRDRCRQR